MTGLLDLALIRALIMAPGSAATYVLLCPRSSASSFIPPKEILVKPLPRAFAMDLAIEVLPTPGGP